MRFIIHIGLILFVGLLNAQQQAPSLANYLDPYRMNLANCGLQSKYQACLSYRDQWTGIEGRPVTTMFSLSGPVKQFQGAAGCFITHEQLGLHQATSMMFSYSQVFPMDFLLLSVGGGLGYEYGKWGGRDIRTPDGVYDSGGFDHKDPNLIIGSLNSNTVSFQPSIYLQSNWIEWGIDLNLPLLQFNQPVLNFYKKNYSLRSVLIKEFNVKNFSFYSHFFFISDFVQFQTEIMSRVIINGNVFGGINLRGYNSSAFDGIGLFFGFKLNQKIWLNYGIELPLNELKDQISGLNQEFGLKYEWNSGYRDKRKPVIYNPRW
ncbi:MAG: type IX secretion system membrane protein PorP/SprF [Saprospiraceae bacterium]|nr:type IX secretion system membrane protein PorP/SprF [Candidatus Vicinibacter proximus]MBL7823396.1 type IX secretion system membrane protein PorP/SprF [Saprospiraceae bacterium]MCC6842427.1 type IX secretion system membrane protein PorP/SprF [Saprospiraceae bacterium]